MASVQPAKPALSEVEGMPALLLATLHHSSGFERTVHHQFGMQAAEGFGHVAIPAHRLVPGENIRKVFCAERAPFRSLGIRA